MAAKRKREAVDEYGDGLAWIRGSMIGKGSFGSVYLATLRDSASSDTFLPPVMAVKSAEVSVSASIQKEREVYSKLEGSPYIINCYGDEITTGNDDDAMAFNLLLEYGAGGTLADKIKKSGGNGIPEFEARWHTRSILRGLKHIHKLGYVHCDLKPANILLVRGGATGLKAKIADLGMAKRVNQIKKRKSGLCWEGTPMYLSPEAVVDHVQEAPSDVWAVGCIVLEMLTGKSALGGRKELGALEILRKIGAGHGSVEIPNALSKEAKAFLKGCFEKNTKFRLSCEMLLKHPFLEGLDEDYDYDYEDDELSETPDSAALVSESDDECSSGSSGDESSDGSEDDECSSGSSGDESSDGSEDDSSLSSSSNKDARNTNEENGAQVVGNGDTRFLPLKNILQCPVSLSIPAGI